MRLLAFIHALILLGAMFMVGRSDYAKDYGYLALGLAMIGMVISARSQTWLGKAVSLWAIVIGVAAVAGWQWSALA